MPSFNMAFMQMEQRGFYNFRITVNIRTFATQASQIPCKRSLFIFPPEWHYSVNEILLNCLGMLAQGVLLHIDSTLSVPSDSCNPFSVLDVCLSERKKSLNQEDSIQHTPPSLIL